MSEKHDTSGVDWKTLAGTKLVLLAAGAFVRITNGLVAEAGRAGLISAAGVAIWVVGGGAMDWATCADRVAPWVL